VGDWRQAIATEKAGIIEPGSHLVLGDVGADVDRIFLSRPAREQWAAGYDLTVTGDQLAVGGHLIGLHTPFGEHDDIYLSLHGSHQVENALLALGAVEAFFGRRVDTDVLQEAWGAIRLIGRCEVIRRHPTVVLDGAHNPDGAAALHEALSEFPPASRRIVVFGALQDRDVGAMLAALGVQPGDLVLACEPDSERAMDPTDVEFVVAGMGIDSEVVRDPASALERALSVAGDDDLVVVTGSIYTVGEVGRVWRDAFASSGDGPGRDDFGEDGDLS
jgi:dihydrofolate synthase/folylpolyglutamate synthase